MSDQNVGLYFGPANYRLDEAYVATGVSHGQSNPKEDNGLSATINHQARAEKAGKLHLAGPGDKLSSHLDTARSGGIMTSKTL